VFSNLRHNLRRYERDNTGNALAAHEHRRDWTDGGRASRLGSRSGHAPTDAVFIWAKAKKLLHIR
jgi:hypothetical protein